MRPRFTLHTPHSNVAHADSRLLRPHLDQLPNTPSRCPLPLQELKDEYFAHLRRPTTPTKTFRVRCFISPAKEEPLTPDEILEGETFFRWVLLLGLGCVTLATATWRA